MIRLPPLLRQISLAVDASGVCITASSVRVRCACAGTADHRKESVVIKVTVLFVFMV